MPRGRLQHIYDLARTKSVCEGGDSAKENQDMMGEDEDVLKQTVMFVVQASYIWNGYFWHMQTYDGHML